MDIAAQIQQAIAEKQTLTIRGSGSKAFYGNVPTGEVLSTQGLTGIVAYDPRELTITARAGTTLKEIEATLAANKQMLPFEPPHFGDGATLGGCVATGLGGPRRPYAGAVRDAVLGVELIDGRGQCLHFGGRVIKNVAGYDVSRLVVGSLGILGVLTEVTIKLLPQPSCERTLSLEINELKAIEIMNQWAARPLPLSATAWLTGSLVVRLSGAESAVNAAIVKLGGEKIADGAGFWAALREQTLPEFGMSPLWRLSVPSTTPPIAGTSCVEWGGAVRWVVDSSDAPRHQAVSAGGHATLFRGIGYPAFASLSAPMKALHLRIRQIFDPHGVFDSARLNP
ncbi:MAG: glycolate oxidase subunit GlcE [Methylophilales bacterium]|nr:glycolate oxidase subunit GlcE [Methylophilales bacterium]